MVRAAAFLASALLNLAGVHVVVMPAFAGIRMTEPSLVNRSSDGAGLSIVTDLGSGSATKLFEVSDADCPQLGPGRDLASRRLASAQDGLFCVVDGRAIAPIRSEAQLSS